MSARRGSMHWVRQPVGLHYQYDKEQDVMTIEGQRYTGEFFRQIGQVSEEGITLMMMRKADGMVAFERVED